MPSLWYTPDEVFTQTWPLPAGGAFCAEGDEPAEADFDAEVDFAAGAAAGAGADDFAGAAAGALVLELEGVADESAAAVFLERDFLVVAAGLDPDAEVSAEVEADLVLEAGAVDASLDESAAAFFERDFLVVEAVEESVPDAVDDFDAEESSAAALDFLDFEVEVEPEVELSVELASAEVDFFFFLDLVVLLPELEPLVELLASGVVD